jgi:hypothetical protein
VVKVKRVFDFGLFFWHGFLFQNYSYSMIIAVRSCSYLTVNKTDLTDF